MLAIPHNVGTRGVPLRPEDLIAATQLQVWSVFFSTRRPQVVPRIEGIVLLVTVFLRSLPEPPFPLPGGPRGGHMAWCTCPATVALSLHARPCLEGPHSCRGAVSDVDHAF